MSYVTGAHNMKFGYQGGFSNPTQTYYFFGEIIGVRMNNGVVNRLTQTIAYPDHVKYVRNLLPTNFYCAGSVDQRPADAAGRRAVRPPAHHVSRLERGRPGVYGVSADGDRVSVAIDAGNPLERRHAADGRRLRPVRERQDGLKFNLGQVYGSLLGDQYRPRPQSAHSHDHQHDAVVDRLEQGLRAELRSRQPAKNGECGAMANQNFGKEVFTRSYDPNFVTGWGNRPYNWGLGVSVQQEVLPRVSVNVGYFRNWWGNWYVVDNRSTTLADYTPFSIMAPVDPRLPGGGGQTISGL